MENKAVCKDKRTAISILQAIALHTKAGVKKTAIESVISWIEQAVDELPESYEERKKLIERIDNELLMAVNPEVRRCLLSNYCRIDDGREFNICILPPNSDCMIKPEGIENYVE